MFLSFLYLDNLIALLFKHLLYFSNIWNDSFDNVLLYQSHER